MIFKNMLFILLMTKRKEHIIENDIEKKQCCTCKKYQELSNFNKSSSAWDKLRTRCKECMKNERLKRKDKITEYNKKYWQETKEEQSIKHKKWRESNIEYLKEYNKKYREKNGKEIDKRDWQKRKNDKKYREYQKNYRREYDKNKRKNDPSYKLKQNLSRRIREVLKSNNVKKNKRSLEYTGCTASELYKYLESLFIDNMSWENMGKGGWDIDHRKPVASFDLSNKEERKKCFHYTNLQPMWHEDNMQKKDSFNESKFNYLWKDDNIGWVKK